MHEIQSAEKDWNRHIQETMFSEEIQSLDLRKEISSTSSILLLNPFLDECHVMRLGGRLQEYSLPFNSHPIILPRKSHFSNLLIMKIHNDSCHFGVNSTLTPYENVFG